MRVLQGFEWDLASAAAPRHPDRVVAVSWNIERGKRLDGALHSLARDPVLQEADLVLLNEVDVGTGRVNNRNVPRELASALGYDYMFANGYLLMSPGDAGELGHGVPNTLAMHGNALLTRYPIRRFAAVPLPEWTDKFRVLEKRIGLKRALLCEVELPDGPLLVAVVHLDPFCPPRHRAAQMRMVLSAVERFGTPRVLLGGDLNTSTYDMRSGVSMLLGMAAKGVRLGLAGTIEHYLTPELVDERELFQLMRGFGIDVEGFNDRSKGTLHVDVNDPIIEAKAREYMPPALYDRLIGYLEPWGGRIPLRLDWFAGRGVTPRTAHVVDACFDGVPVADHDPIAVEVTT